MPTIHERSDLVVIAIRDALPGNISLANRTKIAELMRRLVQIELLRYSGAPDEAGNAGGVEDN